jgi:hypothetical protein
MDESIMEERISRFVSVSGIRLHLQYPATLWSAPVKTERRGGPQKLHSVVARRLAHAAALHSVACQLWHRV